MNIIVCIKQVPDTNEVRINQETGTLIRDGVPSIINPDDKNAIEGALALKDLHGGHITVLCMGPAQAKDSLKEALAMGADEAILLSDRAFAGSDTWATSTILASAIEAIGNYDLVFCGRQAIDGDTAQVGPETAEFLNIPQVTYAKEIKQLDDKTLEITRYTEYGDYVIRAKMPLMITAIKELNTPRLPHVRGIFQAFDTDSVKVWSIDDIDIDPTQIGLKGSPTNVFRSFVPVKEKNSLMIEGNSGREKASSLISKLSALKLI